MQETGHQHWTTPGGLGGGGASSQTQHAALPCLKNSLHHSQDGRGQVAHALAVAAGNGRGRGTRVELSAGQQGATRSTNTAAAAAAARSPPAGNQRVPLCKSCKSLQPVWQILLPWLLHHAAPTSLAPASTALALPAGRHVQRPLCPRGATLEPIIPNYSTCKSLSLLQ